MSDIPVVYSHFYTSPEYLKHALKSAANFNSEVVLLGDDSNKELWTNHYDGDAIEALKYQQFMTHFVKMSNYPDGYEAAFWKRMFLLEAWMKLRRIERAILLDSDLVTFANYTTELYPLLPKDCLAALVIPEHKTESLNIGIASCHCSYWTLEGISSFTDFCIDSFANRNNVLEKLKAKYRWHRENNIPGGVCEMTLLYLWSLNNARVHNLAKVFHDTVADWGVGYSSNYYENEYRSVFGIKKLEFKDGIPYGYNKLLKKQIKFLCVHCQGGTKIALHCLTERQLNSQYLRILCVNAQRNKIERFVKRITGVSAPSWFVDFPSVD